MTRSYQKSQPIKEFTLSLSQPNRNRSSVRLIYVTIKGIFGGTIPKALTNEDKGGTFSP